MIMHGVKSSQIKEIGHDGKQTLAVRFNSGHLYHYHGVTEAKFADFLAAKSHGAYLGKHIKGAHEFTKIIEKKGGNK